MMNGMTLLYHPFAAGNYQFLNQRDFKGFAVA